MSTKTPFAGLERLGPGEPLSSDGYAFQDFDRATIDRILRVGAVTHKHDAHTGLPEPVAAPAAVVGGGGTIPADLSLSVAYTWLDADNGETMASTAATISTATDYTDPADYLAAVVDYSAGSLLAGDYSYAITVTDGAGGETGIGPAADVTVDPSHVNAEVHISGLALATSNASGGAPAAGWRLWRVQGGGPWYLIGSGSSATDTFTDVGTPGDCTVSPPFSSTVRGSSALTITVSSASVPTAATSFNVYISLDGTFASPALLGNFPLTSLDTPQVVTDLSVIQSGSPPSTNTALPGANQINPDTDIVNWFWKSPVATATDLPSTGNNDGDARITNDTNMIWVWNADSATWTQWNPGGATLVASQHTASYTLQATDGGTVIEFNATSGVTLTIPANVSVNLPVGTVIEVFQYGTGQVTIAGGSGVTLRSHSSLVHTAAQYATVSMRQRDIDEWVLSGDLA